MHVASYIMLEKMKLKKNMIANVESFYFRVSLLLMSIVLTYFASYAP